MERFAEAPIEVAGDPQQLDRASLAKALADVDLLAGAYADAIAGYQRSLALAEATLGPEHPTVATSLMIILASIDLALGDTGPARSRCERAGAILETTLGPEHPYRATTLVCLAEVALEEARAADAVAILERALRMRTGGEAPPDEVEEARLMLARARWDAPEGQGRDRTAAIALAEQVRDAHREAGRAVSAPPLRMKARLDVGRLERPAAAPEPTGRGSTSAPS